MLSKRRQFVDKKILRSIYRAIFESHLHCFSLVWAQTFTPVKGLLIHSKNVRKLEKGLVHHIEDFNDKQEF